MARIAVQKPVLTASSSADRLKDTIATFCYYYPRYTYDEAFNLPIKTISRMLKAVRGEKAKDYIEMLQITRVAQSDKSQPVKSLLERYKREANG
jgi:hypothetical protein